MRIIPGNQETPLEASLRAALKAKGEENERLRQEIDELTDWRDENASLSGKLKAANAALRWVYRPYGHGDFACDLDLDSFCHDDYKEAVRAAHDAAREGNEEPAKGKYDGAKPHDVRGWKP